jgi:hypothetical protein
MLMVGWIFKEILDLVLPEDAQWGDLSKKYTHFSLFKCFVNFYHIQMFLFYMFVQRLNTKFFFDVTDVGPYRPPSTSPIQWRGEVATVSQYDEDYQVVEQNLEGLTVDIPNMSLEEVPRRDQRHTIGVLGSMSRLLRRVARAVMCYHECHP